MSLKLSCAIYAISLVARFLIIKENSNSFSVSVYIKSIDTVAQKKTLSTDNHWYCDTVTKRSTKIISTLYLIGTFRHRPFLAGSCCKYQ